MKCLKMIIQNNQTTGMTPKSNFIFKIRAFITANETEMILPSGIRIGNRQFKRYWKQNIKDSPIIPGSRRDPEMLCRLSSNYMLLGYSSGQIVTRQQKFEVALKVKATKQQLIHQQSHTARIGQKHNMLQHHYREQNPF